MNIGESTDNCFQDWKRQLEAAQSDEDRLRIIEKLIVQYLPYVQMIARPQLTQNQRARFDSEDIRQTIGWRVADRLRDGRLQLLTEPQFKQLLKTMVRNLLQDRAVKRPEVSLDAPLGSNDSAILANSVPANGPTASAEVGGAEWKQILWSEIECQLQPDELYLFREHHVAGATYAELAARLGITSDAVRMRLNRARDRLRQTLEPFSEQLEQ